MIDKEENEVRGDRTRCNHTEAEAIYMYYGWSAGVTGGKAMPREGGQEEEPGKRESKVLGHLVDVSGKNLPEDKKELLTSC